LVVRAVVFDLDGTIVNFNIDRKSVRAEVKKFLGRKGFPLSVFSSEDSVFDILKKVEIRMRSDGEEEQKIARLREDALRILGRYEMEAARITNLVPGALETFRELRRRELKMGVFTVSSETSTETVLGSLGVRDLFDAVITRRSVQELKPGTAPLEATLEALAVKPQEAVVVGKSIQDMSSARELGITAIGIMTDASSRKKLTSAGAQYVIPSLVNLLPLVDQLKQQKQ